MPATSSSVPLMVSDHERVTEGGGGDESPDPMLT